jgi:hypothetical protein
VLLLFDLLIERSRSTRGRILLPAGAKRRGTQQLQGAPLDLDPEVWPSRPTVSAETRGPRKFRSEFFFCFPALRFDVFPPYSNSRYCGAPKPGKEKHKSRNYRSAILMVHRFRSFLSVLTPVLRNIWREVTRKMAAQFEALAPSPKLGRPSEPVELRNHGSRMHTLYDRVYDSAQPELRQLRMVVLAIRGIA